MRGERNGEGGEGEGEGRGAMNGEKREPSDREADLENAGCDDEMDDEMKKMEKLGVGSLAMCTI